MKRLWIFILFVAVLPGYMMAQQQTEYNRKGRRGNEASGLQDGDNVV